MPRRTVLSTAQRAAFERLPTEPDELIKYYHLTAEELAIIKKRRRDSNRLGFAVQLCLCRYPGRTLRAGEHLPQELLIFIAEQTDTRAEDFADYAHRDQTRRAHIAELISTFQFWTFTVQHFRKILQWLVPIAVETPTSMFLVGAVFNELRHRRILHPPLAVVERLVAATFPKAEHQVFSSISNQLSAQQQQQLDEWLVFSEDYSQSCLAWVLQPVGKPSPGNVLKIIARLQAIEALKLPNVSVAELSAIRYDLLVGEGKRVAVQNLRIFKPLRRHAIMTVTLLELRRTLIDEALTTHDRIIGNLLRRSKTKYAELLQKEAQQIKNTVKTFATVGRTLLQAKETGQDVWQALAQAIPWNELKETTETAEALANPRRLNPLQFVDSYYSFMRRYTPALLEQFDFRATLGGQDVLDAIQILRRLNETGKRKLPSDIPTSFIPRQWLPFIYQAEGIDRHYYEICTLGELRNCLRSGDIWVVGSKRYQDIESYLLSPVTFEELYQQGNVPVAVATDYSIYITERKNLLCERLHEINQLVEEEKLDAVTFKSNGFSVKPHRSIPLPDGTKEFIKATYAQLPRVKITDLLVEVDRWTHFTDQFTHLRTGKAAENKQTLLTVILADAINLGFTSMAASCPGTSFKQLSCMADWHMSDEAYSRALAEIVNYHHQMTLVQSWGDGTTSSSDGQQFPLGGVSKYLGHVNPKYGNHPGVIFYTHISDQYSPFHTQLINTNTRDATFVLDGLLYHQSDLDIQEHYTDTAGFTDHVFGLCHLLGFRFAPRLRDIGDLSLFPIGDANQWSQLTSIFGEPLKLTLIQEQWSNILRLASSIRLGKVTASLMLRKLAAYPRQNRLALALRELGRLERTLFILDWMQHSELRARVQAGLNKGESRNALARAVFFNRLGEVRDRSFENQSFRASGLNLVVAAIILWNTFHLEKIITDMSQQSPVPDDFLSYLSPLGWQHINLTGDYFWHLNP